MRTVFLAGLCAGVALAALPGALAAQTIDYFVGDYTCDEPGVLNLALQTGDGEVQYTGWIIWPNSGQARGTKGTAPWADGGLLEVANNKLQLAGRADGLAGIWMDSAAEAPNEDCQPFSLVRTDPPLARFEEAATLAEKGPVDPAAMARLRGLVDSLPPDEMLPDFDRVILLDRLTEARQSFWARFTEARDAAIADTPIDGDGSDYVRLADAWLADDMVIEGRLIGSQNANWLIEQYALIADRLDGAGADPGQLLVTGQGLCDRVAGFYTYDYRGAAAVGPRLPWAFWDRGIAERVVTDLRSCGAEDVASWIVDNFPDILTEGETRRAAKAEVDRLVALPPGAQTLRDTNGLSVSRSQLYQWNMTPERFAGLADDRLQRAREASIAALRANLDAELAAILASDPEGDAGISPGGIASSSLCDRLLDGIPATAELTVDCGGRADALLTDRAIKQAQKRLATLVADAKAAQTYRDVADLGWLALPEGSPIDRLPQAERDAAATALAAERARLAPKLKQDLVRELSELGDDTASLTQCEVIDFPADDPFGKLRASCLDLAQAHNAKVLEARCTASLAEAKAEDLADDYLIFFSPDAVDAVSIREAICSNGEVEIAFGERGGLFSRGRREMTIVYPLIGSEGVKVALEREKQDGKTLWRAVAVDGRRPPQGAPALQCVLRPATCQPQ